MEPRPWKKMGQGRIANFIAAKFAAVNEGLQTHDGRVHLVSGCVGLLRWALRWTTIAYLAGLIVTFVLMRWVGERNVFFAFCIYLPPVLWFLPAFVLVPACLLIWEWRALVASAVCITVSLIAFLQWKPFPKAAFPGDGGGKGRFVVLTNNRGQHGKGSMKPFKETVRPDVMAFQEGGGLAAGYLADPAYAEFKHGQSIGEFTLMSRHPILSQELVTVSVRSAVATPGGQNAEPEKKEAVTVAARFVIDVNGTHVVIYNVHLPTPRETLASYRLGGFLYGLVGIPGTRFGTRRAENQRGWDQRIEMVNQLLGRAKKETTATIVTGDFNMPGIGYCHQRMRDAFWDAHCEAGSGFGFTFPGTSRNPLSLGQPWMRIDHVFADKAHWRVTASLSEPDRPSQHRATAAALELR